MLKITKWQSFNRRLGLVCSIYIANAQEIPQTYTKPSKWGKDTNTYTTYHQPLHMISYAKLLNLHLQGCSTNDGFIVKQNSKVYKLKNPVHYSDVIMGTVISQITSLTIVYSTIYSRKSKKNQSPALLDFVRGIHRWLVNSLHKWPVTRQMFPFDDVIMGT